MKDKKKICFECENRSLVPTDQLGKSFKYKDFKMIPLQSSYELLQCECCGNRSISSLQNRELNELIIDSIKILTKEYLEKIVLKTGLTQKELSKELSISEQYLSYIKNGTKVVSAMTFNYLKLLALCPSSTAVLGINVRSKLNLDKKPVLLEDTPVYSNLETNKRRTKFARRSGTRMNLHIGQNLSQEYEGSSQNSESEQEPFPMCA